MKRIIQLTILVAAALSFGACASEDSATTHSHSTTSSSTGYSK
jgi:hypothetical protein